MNSVVTANRIKQALTFSNRREMVAYGRGLHKTSEYGANPHAAIIEFTNLFIDKVRLSSDKLLVATYRQPEKTQGGVILTDTNLEEDKFQGAAALVLRVGSHAFVDDARQSFGGFTVRPHEWVTFRPVHGVAREFAGLHCRIIQDIHIDSVVEDPTLVW